MTMMMMMMHQMLSRTRVLGSSAISTIGGRRGGVQPRGLPLLLMQQQSRARAYSTNNGSSSSSSSSSKPRLDQSAMGQSEQGKKNQGRWFIFGIHP
ncbi:hypothetical protein H4217_008155, partial [Coemansia sp. RSA 1939]